ncbi:MAG: ATP-binding cassette domain-containing protein, partial [Spirochaetes bacterium]|nr:ATP-binding cassette domain-containing protein [Spirochaetota bacterium]
MELRSEEIKKVYKDRMVVKGVNIHVKSGEIVGLLGPNGAGNTTTFYMLVGFIRPPSGKVFIDNDDVTQLPMFKRARHGLGYLAQEPTIFKGLTIEENLLAV